MPKRRMTAKRLAAQRVWQMAGTKAAEAKWSWSKPVLNRHGFPARSAYKRSGRTTKLRNKAAYHHTGGFKINSELAKVLGHG